MQFTVGDLSVHIRVIALPDDGHLIPTLFQVAIQAIVSDIDLSSLEPFDFGFVVVDVHHLVPLPVPVQALSLLGPELFGILHRLVVHLLVSRVVDPSGSFKRIGDLKNEFFAHACAPCWEFRVAGGRQNIRTL